MSPSAGTRLFLVLVVVATACGGDPQQATTTSSSFDLTTTTEPVTTSTGGVTTTSTTATSSTLPEEVGDLLVVGDWGSGTLPQGAVAGAMQRYAEVEEVEAILTTGDNFYSDDVEFLMHPFGWVEEEGIPFWITWGNHDVETARRIELVNETFDHPPRFTVHSWGGIDVVILDSTDLDHPQQREFLTETIGSSERATIVVFHHPPHSCGSHGGTPAVDEEWVQVFDDDVFLVLSGHEHNYQRFESAGITYVVSGGGGAALTELATCPTGGPEMVAGESIHHFVVLERVGSSVELRAIDINGETFDQVRLGLP